MENEDRWVNEEKGKMQRKIRMIKRRTKQEATRMDRGIRMRKKKGRMRKGKRMRREDEKDGYG